MLRCDLVVSRRALVTGVDRFTGAFLTNELLREGWSVAGLMRHTNERNRVSMPNSVVTYVADLNDTHAINQASQAVRPNAVIHLAAVSHVCHDGINRLYATNVIGSSTLLWVLAREQPDVEAVLQASSAYIHGNVTQSVSTEDGAAHPSNDYGASKLSMKLMALTWMQTLPITLVQPLNYSGVGQSKSFVIPKIVQHFREIATTLELGNLELVVLVAE
jgi:GDP-6-deoxy-D-talose 4-dehydrogenase